MRTRLALISVLLAAGCAAEPPPPQGYYYPPPPPSPGEPPPHATASHRPPAPNEEEVASRIKPLGQGELAASAVEGYMDNQESALRAGLRGRGIVVARTGNDLILNLRDDQLFEGGSMNFSPSGAQLLLRVGEVAKRFDSSLLVVDAYTDTTGSHDQNVAVSQKRAEAVAKELSDAGVAAKRVAAKGFGDDILKIPTGPNVSEPRNRRIEIKISPLVKT